MPFVHHWEPYGLLREFHGHVTSEEILRAVLESHAAPSFDDYRYVINDFRRVTSIELDQTTMDEVAAFDAAAYRSNSRVRVAVVPGLPEVMDTVAAYSASGMSPFVIAVCNSVDAARDWALSSAPIQVFGGLR